MTAQRFCDACGAEGPLDEVPGQRGIAGLVVCKDGSGCAAAPPLPRELTATEEAALSATAQYEGPSVGCGTLPSPKPFEKALAEAEEALKMVGSGRIERTRLVTEGARSYTEPEFHDDGRGMLCDCAKPSRHARAAAPETVTYTSLEAKLAQLRDAGWMVAVHNDYRQDGRLMTFWLFTRDGRAVKGEGVTDAESLAQKWRDAEWTRTP